MPELKITLKETAPCQKELRVEVPAAQVKEELEQVYQQLGRVASVPGFRPGRAPRDLLERHHGTKAKEETLSRLIGRTLDEALGAQAAMDLVGRPNVTDIQWQPDKPLSYVAHLEVAPEVPLGKYKGLKLNRAKTDVTGESVGRVLEHLRGTHSELKPVLEPRAAAAGDFLLADLTAQAAGKPALSKAEGPPQKQREAVIHLDLEKDPDGILKPLVGMNPGESRTVALKDGGTVMVELKQIKQRDLPSLDDAFARTVGPYETLEKLKEAIREDLDRQAEAAQQQHLEAQALRQLGDGWKLDVPPSLVASQARRILKERAVELMNHGVPPEQLQQQEQTLTDQAKLDALKQVKLFFVLRRVASAEGLSASEQEVEERVRALAVRLGTPERELRKDLEQREMLEEIAWGIVRKKVLDLIIREAEITKENP